MTNTLIRAKRNQGGFSLIDVLLALGVAILISGITLTGIRRTNESNQASAVGEQIKGVGTALNTYVSLRYDTLVTAVPGTDDVGSPGTAADPGPRTCVCTVGTGSCAAPGNIKICTITSETLRRNGLLPSNFTGINAFGSAYEYRIRVLPQGGSTVLVDGMVWTQDAYTMEGEERFDLLGQAMMVAGADSGMTRSTATNMEGFNGAWSESSIGVNRLGVLGYRVGYNTFGYAAYLRLNGGEMLGDIDMGNNNIFNIETLKSQDVAARSVHIENGTNGIIFRGDIDRTTPDGMPASAITNPTIGTDAGGGLIMRSDAPIVLQRASDTAGASVQMGDLGANNAAFSGGVLANNIRVGNSSTPAATSGGISAQGTIETTGLIRGHTVTAGNGANNFYSSMTSLSPSGSYGGGGAIYFNAGPSGGGSSGFVYNTTGNIINVASAELRTQNRIWATGTTGTEGVIRADQRYVLGAAQIVLDAMTQAEIGQPCVGQGSISRSGQGLIAQCVTEDLGAGNVTTWRAMGNSARAITTAYSPGTTCTGTGALPGTALTVSCPAGGVAISGGYRYASGAMRAAPQDSYRNGATGWTIRPGPTQAYTGAETQATCWNAFVVCSY